MLGTVMVLLAVVFSLLSAKCTPREEAQEAPTSYNREYVKGDLLPVIDSIVTSGTEIGGIDTAIYYLDDNRVAMFIFSTLYRDGAAVGSLMAFPTDSDKYYISIIDFTEDGKGD